MIYAFTFMNKQTPNTLHSDINTNSSKNINQDKLDEIKVYFTTNFRSGEFIGSESELISKIVELNSLGVKIVSTARKGGCDGSGSVSISVSEASTASMNESVVCGYEEANVCAEVMGEDEEVNMSKKQFSEKVKGTLRTARPTFPPHIKKYINSRFKICTTTRHLSLLSTQVKNLYSASLMAKPSYIVNAINRQGLIVNQYYLYSHMNEFRIGDNIEGLRPNIEIENTSGTQVILTIKSNFLTAQETSPFNSLPKAFITVNDTILLQPNLIFLCGDTFFHVTSIDNLTNALNLESISEMIPSGRCVHAALEAEPGRVYKIGRDRNCEIQSRESSLKISRVHAEIYFAEELSIWILRDKGTKNGTWRCMHSIPSLQNSTDSPTLQLFHKSRFMFDTILLEILTIGT